MRRLVPAILASALCVVVSGSVAFGADLPVKAPRSTYFAPAPVATWSGFYAGGNIGWGWARGDATVAGVGVSQDFNGLIGGGQIGYNFQSGAFVFGVEADAQLASDQHKTAAVAGVGTVSVRTPYFATFRGRAGYSMDNWLFYVTGGAAYSKYTIDATVLGVNSVSANYRWGWTLGAGVEWMFGPRWSAKFEYLYMDTGSYTAALFGVPFTSRLRDNILRLGFNYHF